MSVVVVVVIDCTRWQSSTLPPACIQYTWLEFSLLKFSTCITWICDYGEIRCAILKSSPTTDNRIFSMRRGEQCRKIEARTQWQVCIQYFRVVCDSKDITFDLVNSFPIALRTELDASKTGDTFWGTLIKEPINSTKIFSHIRKIVERKCTRSRNSRLEERILFACARTSFMLHVSDVCSKVKLDANASGWPTNWRLYWQWHIGQTVCAPVLSPKI